jgi:hypothetical protein
MTRERWNGIFVAGVAGVMLAAPAAATLTPVDKCASKKLTAQSNHFNQTMNCNTKTKLETPDPACVQKATDKLTTSFTNAEKPGACIVEGDAADIAAMDITVVQDVVATVKPPGSAAPKPQTKCAVTKATAASKENTGNTKCQKGNLSTPSDSLLRFCLAGAKDKAETTFTKAEAPGACATTGDAAVVTLKIEDHRKAIVHALVPPTPTPTAGPTPTPCTGFIDNGDGTITNCATHLMWEKKDDAGGIHDMDNSYGWSISLGSGPDGSVFSNFLDTLNTLPCFAGHCDWRLPELAELQGIIDLGAAGCGTGQPCVASVFNSSCMAGCSVATCSCNGAGFYYWTNTAFTSSVVYTVYFNNGDYIGFPTTSPTHARAVRSLP